ncbi:general secretion pathway protein GspN [Rhodanobacter sp. C01]|uniref:general secretion pathway protein GspN n=1 Tax=Rhodanobacter sp. C01 TaxID=1945856 RepID=UPI000987C4A5|nr:general secretion pathway protein GspN [Rhodanobacter sp. C01]OOG49564.1 general secretion pathway protein GspN [Rhodanobacter sp. C01]
MNAAHQRSLTPVLVVTAVVLASLLLLLLGGVGNGVHWKAPRPLPPLSPMDNAANPPTPLPLEQFAVVWQKPLFSPDRKPVARMASAGVGLGDLELTGIILTPTLRMALLRDKNPDHREVRLREGASLPDGSVTLLEVHPRSAVFATSAGQTELKLPAGALIDVPKPGMAEAPVSPGVPAGPIMNVQPHDPGGPVIRGGNDQAPPANSSQQQKALERLRENIQKRRAAAAAAANAGVR